MLFRYLFALIAEIGASRRLTVGLYTLIRHNRYGKDGGWYWRHLRCVASKGPAKNIAETESCEDSPCRFFERKICIFVNSEYKMR